MIVERLNEIQDRCKYLPEDELRALSRETGTPLHRLHEVASFYSSYRFEPPPAVEVKVCRDMSCRLRGAPRLCTAALGVAKESRGVIHAEGVSCLGQCDGAPAVSINHQVYRRVTEANMVAGIRAVAQGQKLKQREIDRSPKGWKIDPYNGSPNYETVRQFLGLVEGHPINADSVIESLKVANLRGMGGAGFPTHIKWSSVRKEATAEKYIVCNADESEPGTFKDRELLRRTPYLMLEGMILAGVVTGATKGYVYIRHEYEEEIEIVRQAIERAEAKAYCGDNILGSGKAFRIEVFVSPGGYIQGEETALLEAIEDRRGEPRNKPPFPTTHGLRGKPTVINNVETLAWVPAIILRGGEWYAKSGVNGATGLRFVSISGDVNRPGVYEVPFGQTVEELIYGTAEGMRDGQDLKAIAPSGPSAGFLPAEIQLAHLKDWLRTDEKKYDQFVARMREEKRLTADGTAVDTNKLPLDFGTFAQMGSMLGAAFVVIGANSDLLSLALNCTEFYRNESCGKCVPCRMGSQRLTEIVSELMDGKHSSRYQEAIRELAETTSASSICGLGQVAANPILTLITFFPNELESHLRAKSRRSTR